MLACETWMGWKWNRKIWILGTVCGVMIVINLVFGHHHRDQLILIIVIADVLISLGGCDCFVTVCWCVDWHRPIRILISHSTFKAPIP